MWNTYRIEYIYMFDMYTFETIHIIFMPWSTVWVVVSIIHWTDVRAFLHNQTLKNLPEAIPTVHHNHHYSEDTHRTNIWNVFSKINVFAIIEISYHFYLWYFQLGMLWATSPVAVGSTHRLGWPVGEGGAYVVRGTSSLSAVLLLNSYWLPAAVICILIVFEPGHGQYVCRQFLPYKQSSTWL